MAEKARQPLPWDMRVLAGKGLVEMPFITYRLDQFSQTTAFPPA